MSKEQSTLALDRMSEGNDRLRFSLRSGKAKPELKMMRGEPRGAGCGLHRVFARLRETPLPIERERQAIMGRRCVGIDFERGSKRIRGRVMQMQPEINPTELEVHPWQLGRRLLRFGEVAQRALALSVVEVEQAAHEIELWNETAGVTPAR
jgi:hypothetical protein